MNSTPDKRSVFVRLLVLYAFSMLLIVVVFSAFRDPGPSKPETPVLPEQRTGDKMTETRPAPVDSAAIRELEQLQVSITEKNALVAKLNAQLAAAVPSSAAKAVSSNKDKGELARLKFELAEKNRLLKSSLNGRGTNDSQQRLIRELETRNTNLVNGFKSLQTQLGLNQKNYNILRAENARLREQLTRSGASD